MNQNYTIFIKDDGTIDVAGICFDSTLTLLKREGDTLLIKRSAGTHWTGNYCPRGYHSPQLFIWRVRQEVEEGRLEVEALLEYDLKRKSKPYLKKGKHESSNSL